MLRLSLIAWAASAWACTCVGPDNAKEAAKSIPIVFRGTVSHVEKLPEHPKMRGRQRFAVTFVVDTYWKGESEAALTLYDLSPGTDCKGHGYEQGRTYLVFAQSSKSYDVILDSTTFWYGWTDLLPEGSRMLEPASCAPGGQVDRDPVRKWIRELGRGKHPKSGRE